MTGRRDAPPRVSVVTIFYNAPVGFFRAAIDSVLAQTESRWELLLVDDGSTDASSAVARAAAASNPDRIRVLTHPRGANRGMSASRNLGIAHATGEFVAFLDADDLYLPEKLERQLAALADHPEAAIVYGPTLHWWSWSGAAGAGQREHRRRLGVAPDTLVAPPGLVRAFLDGAADTPATCGVLVRRSAIEAVGGFEPRFADLYEDQAFFYKLLLAYPAFVAADSWDLYRRHPDAMCEVRIRAGDHADDDRPTAARRAFLDWLEGYLAREGAGDADLQRSLERALWPVRHPYRRRLGTALQRTARAWVPVSVRRASRQLLAGRH